MKKRRFAPAAAALLAALMLTGCAQEKTVQETPAQREEKMQIGLSFDSFVIERWTRDRDMFVSTAQSLGAEVNVQVAGGDIEEQISQIEYFIKKKMDAIVIIAIDGEALSDVVKRAREQGIKVICYDRLIPNVETDLYITFDNERVGELMGEALVNACPGGGKIFMINGSPTDHNVEMVDEGFMRAIEDSGLDIVYTNFCDNWLAELAFEYTNEGLSELAYTNLYDDWSAEQTSDTDEGQDAAAELVGIMCGNDDLASQSIRALSENRMAGKVAVVAQDAELSACQRIAEGTQTMTVFKPVEELAKKAAELSVALIKGEGIEGQPSVSGDAKDTASADDSADIVETTIEMPDNASVYTTVSMGDGYVPAYLIEPIAVTAENLDEVIIESGFHRREDVYLNIK